MKQSMVVLMIICILTTNVGFASAIGVEDENFDSFFEQALIFPVAFESRVYIDGTTHFMNGPVAQKDGVCYISMVMLEQLMGDQRVVFNGINEEGRIGYIQVPEDVMSWGYSEGDLLSFEAWVGKTECSVNGKAEVLSHAPYGILLENGTPYTMLPFKDVCRLLGKYYVEYDGLIIICEKKQELYPAYKEKLATIKKQLTKTFTGENMNYMQDTESGILFYYGENTVPLPGYQRYWVYASQNANGDPFVEKRTSEPVSTIVRKDLISGETEQIAKVANAVRHNNEEVYYLAASNIEGTALADGYLLRMFYFGGNAMSSYEVFFYVGNDGQVIPLTEDEIVNYYFLGQEMYYFTHGYYFQSSVPGPGELYRVNLLQGTQQRIGREDMKYRQMEPLDADTFLLAALAGEEATTSYLYRLQLSDGKQVQLGKDEMMPLKMNDEKIIFFEYWNDRILYCSAKDRLLYGLSRDGRKRKLLCSQPMGTKVQLKENCGYFIGDNGHLYQTLYDGAAAKDISGNKIRQYVIVGEQVFYICDGYQAGLYLWERGEKKLILAENFKQIAADALGRVVVLPLDACAEYYVYEQGEIRQASLT